MKNYAIILCLFLYASCKPKGTCEHFNIDSYEMITGIDIPPVVDVTCHQERKFRTSVFKLNEKELKKNEKYKGMMGYLKYFDFSDKEQPIIQHDIAVGRDLYNMTQKVNVYSKTGETENYNWSFVVIPKTFELMVEVEHK